MNTYLPLRWLPALTLSLLGLPAFGQVTRTYTTTADFQEGTLSGVNTSIADQLQLDTLPSAGNLPFVCVALSAVGTVVRIDANTGTVLGEYRTAPNGFATNPSRTAVDALGNVWVGNQAESSSVNGTPKGSVVKIGIVVGGTRTDALGNPDPNGEYLKPPFQYSTAIDRDGDGLIRTSRGLGNSLAWNNVTDGVGGADGLVQDAQDELILVYQRVNAVEVRHVSVDAAGNAWIGGYPGTVIQPFQKLRASDGAILATVSPTCGGNGGVIDANGILWSAGTQQGQLLRLDTNTLTSTCLNQSLPAGVTVDPGTGNVWLTEFLLQNRLNKLFPSGNQVPGFPVVLPARVLNRTLAVTPADGHAWVAGQNTSNLSRMSALGVLVKQLPMPTSPVGVSVDANGKVWVACGAGQAVRIDPNGGADGLGAIDLQVNVGAGSVPFNYGSMTGSVPLSVQQPNGSWKVVYDSGAINTEFGKLSFTANVPAQTALVGQFRVANTPAELATQAFQPINNGVAFAGVFGRFVEAQFDFTRANPSVTATPQLLDFTIESLPGGPDPECVAGLRYPGSLLVFPEFDNRQGDLTLLTVTNTAEGVDPIKVEFVYIGRYASNGSLIPCLEYNRTETLTPNDTLSVITSAHNPNHSQGYVYVFAKNKLTGRATVHNHLAGHAMVIQGITGLDYSYEPEVFYGIGAAGADTDRDNDGLRDLNNLEYSCAPDEILIPRFLGQRDGFVSHLVLLNLTGGAEFTATLDMLAYNDNEEPYSGQLSFQCWAKLSLLDISQVFSDSFLRDSTGNNPNEDIGVETGWLRLNGLSASSPAATLADPAFLALLVERTGSPGNAADLPFVRGTQANGDLLSRSIFADTTP